MITKKTSVCYLFIWLCLPSAALHAESQLRLGKVVSVNPGTHFRVVDEYRCYDQTVEKRQHTDNRERLRHSIVGGALGYGLGHESSHREEIAALGAVAGALHERGETSIRYDTERVCRNVRVNKPYLWGYDLVVEYEGKQYPVYSVTPYKLGDSYALSSAGVSSESD